MTRARTHIGLSISFVHFPYGPHNVGMYVILFNNIWAYYKRLSFNILNAHCLSNYVAGFESLSRVWTTVDENSTVQNTFQHQNQCLMTSTEIVNPQRLCGRPISVDYAKISRIFSTILKTDT